MKTILIAPTINEVEALPQVLPKIDKSIVNEIIIVDLNSTDGTVEYCRQNGFRVHHQKSRGYGAGIIEVLAEIEADIIIEFPPDGSSPPEKIPDLLSKLNEGYDLVIGSRYLPGAKSYDDSLVTHFGNWFFSTLVNVLFGTHYTDTLVGFRVYRRSAYNKMALDTSGLSWTAQQACRAARAKLKVAEIPADEPARIGGVRKMKPLKTGLEILKVIIREFLNPKKFTV